MTIKTPTKSAEINFGFTSEHVHEFTDSETKTRTNLTTETGRSALMPLEDRRRLMDIEIFLTNCLNLAQAVESKDIARAIQLIREARDEIKRDA